MNEKSKQLLVCGLLLVVTAVSFTGCGQKSANANEDTLQWVEGTANTPVKGNNTNGKANGRMPGNGQFAQADITGEVTLVDGRKVTLKLIEVPKVKRSQNKQNNSKNGSSSQTGTSTEPNTNTQKASSENSANNNQDNSSGTRQRPTMEIKYTGETKTLTLPDNLKVQTMERTDNSVQTKEIELKDVTKGQIFQVWFKKDSKEVIKRVMIGGTFGGGGMGRNFRNKTTNTDSTAADSSK